MMASLKAKSVIAAGVVATVLVGAAMATPPKLKEAIQPVTLQSGKVIDFTYTDSTDGETIGIYTNKSNFSDNVFTAEVYFAMTVPKTQDIDVSVLVGDQTVDSIEWLEPVTVTSQEPQYTYSCPDLKEPVYDEPTDTYIDPKDMPCTVETISGYKDVKKTYYAPISAGRPTDSKDAKLSKEWSKATVKKTFKAGTYYGRATVHLKHANDSQFLIEAKGSKGDYGILDPWFNNSWLYKKTLEINPNHASSTVSNFPVYIQGSDLGSDFFSHSKSDLCDLRIVKSDDSSETPFEIATSSPSVNTAEIWFLADSVSSSATSTFYVYYGNSSASCYSRTDTYGSDNVWTAYALVTHNLQDDSSPNDLTITKTSTATTTGQIGDAQTFDKSATRVDIADNAVLDITGAITVSAWARADSLAGGFESVLAKGKTATSAGDADAAPYLFGTRSSTDYRFGITNSSNDTFLNQVNGITTGTWYFFVGTWNGSTSTNNIGSCRNSFCEYASQTTVTAMKTNAVDITLGFDAFRSTDARMKWDGIIDEVRVSAQQLSNNWIATEWNNQNSPSTFYWVGSEQNVPASTSYPDDGWIIYE